MESSQHRTWHAHAEKRWYARFARDLRRSLIVLSLLALSILLVYLLFPPFFAPQTHLVLLGAKNGESFNSPAIAFVGEDLEMIGSVAEAKVHDHSELFRSAQDIKRLSQTLAGDGIGGSDHLIVYVTAHGISEGTKAYLLCDNFELRRPEAGRIAVDRLLSEVSGLSAKTKLIVLNAGTIEYDPRMGVVGNDFPRLLEKAVQQANDPSLWVYCSHSSLQYSHVSRAAKKSVFGMFFGAGMKGAADLDGNRRITLNEIVDFTSANVSNWVDQSTDRAAKQTPKLIWGGGGRPTTDPSLLTLFDDDAKGPLSIASLIGATGKTESGQASMTRSGNVQGLMRRHQVTLTSSQASTPNGQTKPAAKPGETNAEPKDANGPDTSGAVDDPTADGAAETPAKGSHANGADAESGSRQLLAGAWKQRDEAAMDWSAADPKRGPVEIQPHLWRELEAELLGYEQRIRGGRAYDLTAVESVLKESFATKKAAAKDAKKDASPSPIESLFGHQKSPAMIDAVIKPLQGAQSLAFGEMAAALENKTGLVDVDLLESSLEKATRKEFDDWFKKNWHPRYAGYVDLAYLKRLAETTDIDWDLIQTSAKLTLLGERVAALDWMSPEWIRQDVQRADQYRFFAEQLIFNQVGLHWRERLVDLLGNAERLYLSAQSVFVQTRTCEHSLDVLMAKFPSYLRWNRLTRSTADARLSIGGDLASLLDLMSELSQILGRPNAGNADQLSGILQEIELVQSRIEFACGDTSAESLLGRAPTIGDSYQAEVLLATPLLTSSARSDLMSSMEDIDRQLASRYELAKVNVMDGDDQHAVRSGKTPTQEDWSQLVEQARLESKFIALSNLQQNESGQVVTNDSVSTVMEAFDKFASAHRELVDSGTTDSAGDPASSNASLDALWMAHSAFGKSLQDFYRVAVQVPGSAIGRPSASREAVRMLSLIDPRDAWRLAQVDVDSISLGLRIRSMLQWQTSRYEQAALYRDQTTTETDGTLGGDQPSQVIAPSEIVVNTSGTIDLQYGDSDALVIEVQNRSDNDVSINLSLDYERKLIEVVESETAKEVADEGNGELRFLDSPSQFGSRRSNTIAIAAGTTRKLSLMVHRRQQASDSTKLVFDVFARSTLTRSASTPPTLLARRTLNVQLPVCEVAVQQGTREYVSGIHGVELLPHPNRLETFRFGVVNRSSKSKQIAMTCYALAMHPPGRMPTDPTALLATATPIAKFEIAASGDGVPVFPSAGEPEKKDSEKKESDSEPAKSPDASEDAAKEGAEPKPIKSTQMPYGMLVALTDMDTGQSTYRTIKFAVQRPRRFVVPRVGFDVVKKQIKVQVSASDPNRLPVGNPVRVSCNLTGDLAGQTKGKLQGFVSRSSPVANLFIAVSTPPPYLARVYIDVDGYPRSFIFDVPCGKQVTDVPEVTGLTDLRMATSSDNGILAATQTIPVAVELDAPVGSFEDGQDYLDLGIDLDQTGAAKPEDSIRVSTDRSVKVGFVKSLPNGTMELHTVVADHVIDLPAERLENLYIDVAASLMINGRMHSFPSIPLLIDTAPPIVGPVNRSDGLDFVSVNGKLDLTAWAWDEGSRVQKVEAAFDIDGSGEFPAAGAVFTASQTSVRQWTLTVDVGAEAGKKTLLVRGVDQVGNASEPVPMDLEVLSAGENTKRVHQQTVDLDGTILFREKAVAEAEVRLIEIPDPAPEGEPAAPPNPAAPSAAAAVRSTENGRYSILGVAPGNYRLAARGIIRNRVHRVEKEVVVTVGPQRKMRVDVVLP